MTAISHVLKDKQRLRRRTQLKRCHLKILGRRKNNPVEEQVKEMEYDIIPDDMVQPNMHLMDFDEEIFDDEDFYHQVSCLLFFIYLKKYYQLFDCSDYTRSQ